MKRCESCGCKLADTEFDQPGVYLSQVPFPGGRELQAKQTVRELLDRLPDDCSLDDVQYHLYVLQSIARGRADAEAGRTISHEDVARELRKKWLANAAG